MADVGELVLLIGDFHIPHRQADIPDEFRQILVPGRIQHVICTGNLLSKQVEEYLRTLAPSVHIVRGDMDINSEHPDSKVIKVGAFSIGVCHGHQVTPWGDPEALGALQRQLDCDVLVTGHTHMNSLAEFEKKYLINPGSATGAFSPISQSVVFWLSHPPPISPPSLPQICGSFVRFDGNQGPQGHRIRVRAQGLQAECHQERVRQGGIDPVFCGCCFSLKVCECSKDPKQHLHITHGRRSSGSW